MEEWVAGCIPRECLVCGYCLLRISKCFQEVKEWVGWVLSHPSQLLVSPGGAGGKKKAEEKNQAFDRTETKWA